MRGNRVIHVSIVVTAVLLAILSLAQAGRGRPRFGELVIEDSELVAWTPINNTFNKLPGASKWDGLLIQVGDFLKDGRPFYIFKEITFEDIHGTVGPALTRGTFSWIDIVAVDPNRSAPVDPSQLPLLYPAPGTSSGCSAFDACAIAMCTCANPPCAPSGYEPLTRCVRARSLHGTFIPFAVITMWQGQGGVDLAIRPHKPVGETSEYVFTFRDPVQIYIDGQPLALGKIDRIVVNSTGESRHDTSDDPPWYP